VRVEAPGAIPVALRRREGLLLVHLLNRAVDPPTDRRSAMIERGPPQGPVTRRPHCADPSRVYAVPDDPPLEARWDERLLTATLPVRGVHTAIVVEGAGNGRP